MFNVHDMLPLTQAGSFGASQIVSRDFGSVAVTILQSLRALEMHPVFVRELVATAFFDKAEVCFKKKKKKEKKGE